MGASWMFLYEAYSRIGVSIASLLYHCGPVIVMALSPLLFGERLTLCKMAGFLSVLVGVVLVNGRALQNGGDVFGIACGLLSAVTYAVMVICNKKAKEITGLENATLQRAAAFFDGRSVCGLDPGRGYGNPAGKPFAASGARAAEYGGRLLFLFFLHRPAAGADGRHLRLSGATVGGRVFGSFF